MLTKVPNERTCTHSALTEKIVAALPRLKCPLRLEPHQIQGLDHISIFPVVQWLVKKALETRDELQQQYRNRALFEFGKFGKTPEDITFEKSLPSASSAVALAQGEYVAKRQLKAPDINDADEETQVQCTLLEYGQRYGISKVPTKTDSKAKASIASGLTGGDTEEDLIELEEKRVRAIIRKMEQLGEGGSAISSSVIGSIAGVNSAQIKELSDEYAALKGSLNAEETAKAAGVAAHRRAVASLEKQTEMANRKLQGTQEELEKKEAERIEAETASAKAKKRKERIDKEMAKLDVLEGDEANREVLEKLRALVRLGEQLKLQDQQFQASCLSELAEFEKKIENISGGEGQQVVNDERSLAIAKQLADDLKKLQKIKLLSARRTREAVSVHRQLDEYPGRSELNQYQRRFVELYEQVQGKLRETKQYYAQYNSLDDCLLYLKKEVSLLESINENFSVAMASAGGKQQLLKQMSQIVDAVDGNRTKMEERRVREKSKRDSLSDTYIGLVEQERKYYTTVREYQNGIELNEQLSAQLESL